MPSLHLYFLTIFYQSIAEFFLTDVLRLGPPSSFYPIDLNDPIFRAFTQKKETHLNSTFTPSGFGGVL